VSNLKLDDIVKVIVNLSPKSAVRKGFNVALIIGDSDVIPIEKRVVVYSGLEEMTEAGFTEDMPEYQAAQLYFLCLHFICFRFAFLFYKSDNPDNQSVFVLYEDYPEVFVCVLTKAAIP